MPPPLPDPASVRSILLRGTNWIGDVVMISPAVRAVRERYPRARIAFLAPSHLAEAMRANPCVDEVIPMERKGRHAGAPGFVRLARELRVRRFEMAVLFPKSFGSALLAWAAGIPIRVGLATDCRTALLTHRRPLVPEDARRHHADVFAEVARLLGAEPRSLIPEMHLAPEDREFAVRFLRDAGVPDASFLLAIHPGASKTPRAWHPERFAGAADGFLSRRPGGRVLLLGADRERTSLAAIRSALRSPAISGPESTTVRQMAACIERASLFLGNDSGPMHLASALGIPTVAIFGPGIPEKTLPLSPHPERVRAVTARFACSPCRQDFFRECKPSPARKPFCIEEVTVGRVVAEMEQAVAEAEPAPAVAGTR